jgi:hypothetical protein
LAPHCWNATSLAEPEYVIDVGAPNAFFALAMTAFASCAHALLPSAATQSVTNANFFTTTTPP